MLDPNRLQSGFDVELHLGRGWLRTALGILLAEQAASFPIVPSIINLLFVSGDTWDIRVNIFPIGNVNAAIDISDDGRALDITTDNTLLPSLSVPLPRFGQLAGPPLLVKVMGDGEFGSALALLANVDIRATPQDEEPLPAGEHLERGDVSALQPVLPSGQHVALGISAATFDRFANHIWHDSLRNDDGEHLIMNGDDRLGVWKSVEAEVNNNRIRFVVKGEADIDNGFVDFFIDANVTAKIDLVPSITEAGALRFEMSTDIDIDTGLMGDFLAFLTGGLLGLPLMFITGGLINPATLSIGAVIALEVGERVVEGIAEREVFGDPDSEGVLPPQPACDQGVVKLSTPPVEATDLSVGPLDAIPSDITIFTDDEAPLFRRFRSVDASYAEIALNNDGLAVAGLTSAGERFVPHVVEIEEVHYDGEAFLGFTYRRIGTEDRNFLPEAEITDRMLTGDTAIPLRPGAPYEDGRFVVPDGRLVAMCLTPEAIHREDTIITHFRFPGDIIIAVGDCVRLQNAGALVLPGLQLIEPREGNPYYRSRPDDEEDNNLESLPEFDL